MNDNSRSHSPQDQIYGPLMIPSYCWPIIDTEEFQRLRNLAQLGPVFYVYPAANHSRFEHSLGCAHLACIFMDHIKSIQPELKIDDNYVKAVIIAALCHDLGSGPLSDSFTNVARQYDSHWSTSTMSCKLLKYIVSQHNIDISS